MSESRYVIKNTIIPATFNATHPYINEGELPIGTEDRYILSCYKLWKKSICYFARHTGRWKESGWYGSSYTTHYHSSVVWGLSGKALDWQDAENHYDSSYPDYPSNSYISRIVYSTRTCYTSHLSHSGSGSVSFYLEPRTVSVGHTFSGGFINKYIGSSQVVGGEVDEDTFNTAAPLHFGNEAVEFRATPDNENIRVKYWKVNGTEKNPHSNTLAISLYSSDMTVECVFEQYKFPVTVKNADDTIGSISKAITSEYHEVETNLGEITATVLDPENYRFAGWYKCYIDNATVEQCTTLVTTEPTLNVTVEENNVTYCAKYASRKTELLVEVSGNGTFDLFVNETMMADDATSYSNDDARDGREVTVKANPDRLSYFQYWLAPYGTANTQNIYTPEYSTVLLSRDTNAFKAFFAEKTTLAFTGAVDGEGSVYYSGELSEGSFTTGETVVDDVYEATEYVFEAKKTSKLYAFDKWQYKSGNYWVDLVAEALPSWVKQIDDNIAVVYAPGGTTAAVGLKAVFRKLNTYTVATPVIEGDHPINKTEASASDSGCSVTTTLAEADEVVDGVSYWVEGTVFEVTATPGAKWVLDHIDVTTPTDTETFTDGSVSVTLDENITKIAVVFTAKQYTVTPEVDGASKAVGTVLMTYLNAQGESLTTSNPAQVYVDTKVTLEATPSVEGAAFHDWKFNGIDTDFANEQEVLITGTSTFTARFKTRHTFATEGSVTQNEKVLPLGSVKVVYQTDGYTTELTLPTEGGSYSQEIELVCGTTFSLIAEEIRVDETTEGHFTGWFENAGSAWAQVVGWGASVEAVQVGVPRSLKAIFSPENRWPILRLRNPSDGLYAAFAVSGVRQERTQVISDSETVTLTNPNDYFCDPFSIVQVRLEQYDSSQRFVKWKQLEFGTTDNPGTTEIGDYSTTKDLSVFMTGNIHLVPIFYTGALITAEVGIADNTEADWGAVSIEGDFVSKESDQKASFVQGDTATFVASPKNGYRFVRWSSSKDGASEVSTSARHSVLLDTAQKLYAVFEQDTNAIYRFGDSDETKQLTWRSKRVDVNSPVSFSTARVDAEGYGVELTVYKSSSPDVPMVGKSYTVTSSNSRRLAVDGRGEKCFEFEVVSTFPVNHFTISTSVAGLLGGET